MYCLRGRGQLHPRQSLLGKMHYIVFGVPDWGLQLRSWLIFTWSQWRRWPFIAPRRILDAGCGGGRFALFLARRYRRTEIVGFDPDPEVLAAARERQKYAEITNAAFVSDPTAVTGAFDLLFAADVIAHVPDREKFGRFLAAHAAPGARLILHTPSGEGIPHFARFRDFDRQQADRAVPFVSRAELADWLPRHGFVPRKWVTTFRRWGGGLAWELSQFLPSLQYYPLNILLAGLFLLELLRIPTAGGGVLVVAERKAEP